MVVDPLRESFRLPVLRNPWKSKTKGGLGEALTWACMQWRVLSVLVAWRFVLGMQQGRFLSLPICHSLSYWSRKTFNNYHSSHRLSIDSRNETQCVFHHSERRFTKYWFCYSLMYKKCINSKATVSSADAYGNSESVVERTSKLKMGMYNRDICYSNVSVG